MVSPFIVPSSHPLYAVSGVYNAIFVKGTEIGDVMFYGSGAGKLPTACAVVADVVDAAKHIDKHIYTFWSDEDLELTGIEEAERSFFVRVSGKSSEVRDIAVKEFGDVRFIDIDEDPDGFGFVTEPLCEKSFNEHLKNIPGVSSRIRLEQPAGS